jgi:PAS domain S-box-containing protein
LPAADEQRARILDDYGLDTLAGDPELARIVRFAAQLCEVPIALVTVVEADEQRFLAHEGLDIDRTTCDGSSFCLHTMYADMPLEVPDASADERFAANEFVAGNPFLRFYAGYPLSSEEGAPLGALCVIDRQPRPNGLTAFQRQGLEILGQAVMRRLRSRRHSLAARREHEERESYMRTLADSIPAIAWSADPEGKFDYFNQRMIDFTGKPEEMNGEAFHPEDWVKASAAWQHSLKTGETYEAEHRLRRSDGQYRWMISRAVPVRDSNGRIVRWFGTAVDIHDLYAASEARDLLAKELSHRIKNIFAVVSSLVALTSRNRPEVRDFARELTSTIHALGRAHDYVRPEDGRRHSSLHGVLADLFDPYRCDAGPRVTVRGDDLTIAPRSATPLALVFHELATNSAKYGALSNAEGTVDLQVADEGEILRLSWTERGGPPPKRRAEEGFGSRLVEMSVKGQLGGSWSRKFEPEGLVCELIFARSALAPDRPGAC